MSKPFDTTLNSMIDLRADQWADCFARLTGIPPGPSVSLDTDLGTSVQADKIFRIDGEKPSLLHLELEANPRLGIPPDVLRYNVLIARGYLLPVQSVLVLLRPKALASDMTGRYRQYGVNGKLIIDFRYHVERVWERPVKFWLKAGIGLAPLALLTDEADGDLNEALASFQNLLRESQTDETTTRSLIGSSYILCGLRYDHGRIAETFRRMSMTLEDSTTYQEILQKGVSQGLSQGISQGVSLGERQLILLLGGQKFGAPSPSVRSAINAISDPAILERLALRLGIAGGWDDLVGGN